MTSNNVDKIITGIINSIWILSITAIIIFAHGSIWLLLLPLFVHWEFK